MTKKNILIIGGTGQFGITMSQILIKKKFNVFATSRFSKKINSLRKIYPKVNYVKLNILNNFLITKNFYIYKPKNNLKI